MGAPSATTRQSPAGIKLDDGFSSKITFACDPDISFWEKSVTPPGIEGGDPVDTTTMHNSTWRTMAPRALRTMEAASASAAYDPAVYDQIVAIVNVETVITITFPDGSTLAFWGYLKTFTPGELVEGTQPECTLSIQPTNQDVQGVEQAPVLVEVPGT